MKVSEIIKNSRTTKQEILIQKLNQVIIGWQTTTQEHVLRNALEY